MKLWILTQDEVDGYDTFDSCVVCANNEYDARQIHPCEKYFDRNFSWGTRGWATSPENVKARCIGKAIGVSAGDVVLTSYNAG